MAVPQNFLFIEVFMDQEFLFQDIINNILKENKKWDYLKNTENRYIITTNGEIYSSYYKNKLKDGIYWHEISHRKTQTGYHRVMLKIQGNLVDKYIHRLILETFSPIDGMEFLDAAHLDDNKDNNNLSNLKWMTRLENNHWNHKIERGAQKRKTPLIQYTLNGIFVDCFESTRDVERKLGFDHSKVSKCAKGILDSYHGYLWRFKKDVDAQHPEFYVKEE